MFSEGVSASAELCDKGSEELPKSHAKQNCSAGGAPVTGAVVPWSATSTIYFILGTERQVLSPSSRRGSRSSMRVWCSRRWTRERPIAAAVQPNVLPHDKLHWVQNRYANVPVRLFHERQVLSGGREAARNVACDRRHSRSRSGCRRSFSFGA